jgi:hypothetical protein
MAAGRASRRCLARHTSPIPPLTNTLHQEIAAQLARAADLFAQAIDDVRADIRHQDDEEIGEGEAEEENRDGRRGQIARAGHGHDDRHGTYRQQGRHHRAFRRGRHDDGKQHRPDRDPGKTEELRVWHLVRRRPWDPGIPQTRIP